MIKFLLATILIIFLVISFCNLLPYLMRPNKESDEVVVGVHNYGFDADKWNLKFEECRLQNITKGKSYEVQHKFVQHEPLLETFQENIMQCILGQ